MKNLKNLAVMAVGALLFSCNQPIESNTLDQANVAQQIEERNQQWMAAIEHGEAVEVASFYTSNSQFMPPNMPTLEGREGIKTFIENVRNSGVKKIKVATSDLTVDGGRALEVGTYQILVAGDQVVDNGKYMLEWRLQGDQWYMHRDIFNSNLPAPRSVAQQGQPVWVVVHKVKAERRQDFENFVRNTLIPAIDQNKPEMGMAMRHTRFLTPSDPEADGSYPYMFVMDPVIEGADYIIENMIIEKYGEEQGSVIVKDFSEMMAAPFLSITGMQTEY